MAISGIWDHNIGSFLAWPRIDLAAAVSPGVNNGLPYNAYICIDKNRKCECMYVCHICIICKCV